MVASSRLRSVALGSLVLWSFIGSLPLLIGLVIGLGTGCGDGGGFPDARAIDTPPPAGTISLAWSLTDSGGAPITCDRVGGIAVTAVLRNLGVDGGSTQVFTCNTGMGTSQGVAPGTYDITFELTGTTGQLATAPAQHNIVVTSGQDTALTPIVFAVGATGALKLHLVAKPGGNCKPTAGGGAGITGNTLTLELGGACATQTFAIGAGATQPAGSYTVNCATPPVSACIDNDQELSIASLPSGSYTLKAKGQIAGAACWSTTSILAVPPGGGTLTQTIAMVYATGAPGCP
jgi:hypothetical protein